MKNNIARLPLRVAYYIITCTLFPQFIPLDCTRFINRKTAAAITTTLTIPINKMDTYHQSRLRGQGPAYQRAIRPRSRFSDSTLSTITIDTTSAMSTTSGWTDSEDEYRASPPPPPVNPFFRGPRPAPQDVFRFGRRRGSLVTYWCWMIDGG